MRGFQFPNPITRPRWIALLGGALLATTATFVLADTIYLKNDRKVIGVIDKIASDDKRVMIRTSSGTVPVPHANIARIEYQASGEAEASAELAQAQGDLDKAMELYLKAYQETPDNQPLRAKIEALKAQIGDRDEKAFGTAFDKIENDLKAGNFDAAIAEAQLQLVRAKQPSVARRLKEMTARAHVMKARQLKDRVEYQKAEEQYRLALQAYPEGPQAHFELGTLLQQTPATKQQAIPLFQTGIDLARREPGLVDEKTLMEYQNQLGQIYLQSQKYTEAADLFLDLARRDKAKSHPKALDLMLEAYSKVDLEAEREDIEHIVANLKAAIEINPQAERAYITLGRIYFARKDWQQARDMLSNAVSSTALAQNQAMKEAFFYLGISHRRLGEIDRAAEVLQAVYNSGTPTYDMICELAEVRLEQVGLQQALELFTQARALDHNKYRAYLGLGDTLILLKRFSEARDNYNEVIKRDPMNFKAQMAIAKTLYMDEMMPEAAAQAQRTIEQIKAADPQGANPELKRVLAETYTLLGNASLAQNQVNMAQESFGKSLAIMEEYPPALEGMGKSLQADKKYIDAQKYFERAIAADPKNADYRLSLAIFYHKYLKKTEEALPNYLAYLNLGGKDPNVRTWIADCGGTPPGSINEQK